MSIENLIIYVPIRHLPSVFCPLTSVFCPLHLSRGLYKSHLFMQNKANFLDAQMNVNSILTKDYERNDIFAVPENKANSNPIKANTKPMKANKMPKQTQSNPISLLPKSPKLTTLTPRNPSLTNSYLNSPNLDNIWLLFLLIQVLYGLKYNYARKRQNISHLRQCRRAKRRRPLRRLDNRFTEKQLQYRICRRGRSQNGQSRL